MCITSQCAKNTITVLVASGVVITILVYPALAIQLYSQPLAQFSTRISDAWFAYNPTSTAVYVPRVPDLWDVCEGVRIRDEAQVIARCGGERSIAIERIF